ncbi:MAG: hypothetical protein HYU67_00505 [Flavobacteriia bacterium]|nr:hypothetical protein [Flavobacteriia bacterium]
MIIATKYIEAYIKGDMETLIKLGYKDSITGKTGILKEKGILAYKKDKTKFTYETWKIEVLKFKINPRLSKDFRISDYKKGRICSAYDESFDDFSKPIINVIYSNENEVTIRNILTFDYINEKCKYLGDGKYEAGTEIRHDDIELVKYKGKWLVKDLR